MEKQCANAIVHCIDFRFQDFLDEFMQNHALNGNCDRISLAGGVKDIAVMYSEVEISHKLHHTERIYLINHQDCGGYGLDDSLSELEEKQFHATELEKTKHFLNDLLPEVEIEAYFLTLQGEFLSLENMLQ